jgi:MATE family multidrug resistance protein
VPALLTVVWKNHADALNRPWPAFWIVLGGILLNVLLNWLWIYGNLGFPALGIAGAAWATLASRIATAAGRLWWLMRAPGVREWTPRRWLQRCNKSSFVLLLVLGIPASLQLLTEVTAFAAGALLIGTLGAVPLAAHQVAITCAATTFMVPLGVAMAMTVRVGEVVGAQEWQRMHRVLLGGWVFAAGFMGTAMVCFLIWGRWLAGQFVVDQGVVEIAASLLVIAAIFQLFDGLQVVSAGALRGVGDVRVPAWIALAAYWFLAIPLGATMAFTFGWGAQGMWIGLAAGLAVAAVALGDRAWRRLARSPMAG